MLSNTQFIENVCFEAIRDVSLLFIYFVQRVFEEDIATVVAEPEKKPVEVKEKTRQEKEAEIVPKFCIAVKVFTSFSETLGKF